MVGAPQSFGQLPCKGSSSEQEQGLLSAANIIIRKLLIAPLKCLPWYFNSSLSCSLSLPLAPLLNKEGCRHAQRDDGVGPLSLKTFSDLVQYPICSVKHQLVFEAYDSDTTFIEVGCSYSVLLPAFFSKMTGTIQLKSQLLGMTIKVQDIISDTMLPPEFSTSQLVPLQKLPHKSFGRSQPFS